MGFTTQKIIPTCHDMSIGRGSSLNDETQYSKLCLERASAISSWSWHPVGTCSWVKKSHKVASPLASNSMRCLSGGSGEVPHIPLPSNPDQSGFKNLWDCTWSDPGSLGWLSKSWMHTTATRWISMSSGYARPPNIGVQFNSAGDDGIKWQLHRIYSMESHSSEYGNVVSSCCGACPPNPTSLFTMYPVPNTS